jgi:hypothetical protein
LYVYIWKTLAKKVTLEACGAGVAKITVLQGIWKTEPIIAAAEASRAVDVAIAGVDQISDTEAEAAAAISFLAVVVTRTRPENVAGNTESSVRTPVVGRTL